jgi:hypothetical protein
VRLGLKDKGWRGGGGEAKSAGKMKFPLTNGPKKYKVLLTALNFIS